MKHENFTSAVLGEFFYDISWFVKILQQNIFNYRNLFIIQPRWYNLSKNSRELSLKIKFKIVGNIINNNSNENGNRCLIFFKHIQVT